MELESQSDPLNTQSGQEFEEYLILDKQKSDESITYTNVDLDELKPQAECIQVLNEKILSSPSNSSVSYNIPKSSVLVLTADGNYVIASLGSDTKKVNEIRAAPPQLEQIIILNSDDLQFAEMEVDQTADDKGYAQ